MKNSKESPELFRRFGMELTYSVKIDHPLFQFNHNYNDDSWCNCFIEACTSNLILIMNNDYKGKNGNSLIRHLKHVHKEDDDKCNVYNDGGSIEVVTPVFNNKQEALKFSEDTNQFLSRFEIVPSCIDLRDEGGCHMTFDLPKEREGCLGLNDHEIFFQTFTHFIFFNPFVVWTFLSPYDNESSVVALIRDESSWYNGRTYKIDSGKGAFYQAKEGNALIELRFFVMPASQEELEVHIDFAVALLSWIWNTKKKVDLDESTKFKFIDELNYQRKIHKTFNFRNSVKGLKQLCNVIDFDYNRLVKTGKIEMLKQRFALEREHPGKYLV